MEFSFVVDFLLGWVITLSYTETINDSFPPTENASYPVLALEGRLYWEKKRKAD